MPIPRVPAALLLAVILATGVGAKDTQPGYLREGAIDVLQILPPAPVRGDARYQADHAIFKRTRVLLGTPRYALATADVDYTDPALLHDFSCATGIALGPQATPLTRLLAHRAGIDSSRQSRIAKDHYQRLRPYQIDRGPTCQSPDELKGSYDYPSGHTTLGWTWALVLADLLPERATAILARGRAYGASRFVCGVHNYSAVEAGYLTGESTMAAIRRTPAYVADADAARAELRRLAADPAAAKPTGCEDEAKLIAMPLP